MSFQMIGENRLETFSTRASRGATRQANAQELLAEFKQALESAGRLPVDRPSSASIASASALTAEPRKSADIGAARDDADEVSGDASPDRGLAGRVADGRDYDLTREARRLLSRRWKLVASGLAAGFVAAAGVGFALMPSAPAPKSSLSEVLAQQPSNVQPPVGESAASGDVGDPAVKDGPRPDLALVGGSDAAVDAQESTKRSAPLEAQRPADVSNAMAVATSTDAPTPAAAAASPSIAAQTPSSEPVRMSPVGPDRTPISTMSSNSAESTSPGGTQRPHAKAATAAGARVESARPSAAKMDSATRPTAGKTSAKKIAVKREKTKAEAVAETPRPPLRPTPPERAEESPASQATADPAPVAAAPTAPTSFAAQSVGQLTHAFAYLTQLPAALVERVAGSNSEAK